VAIRAELRQARALVLPSLWYETLGLVAIEAAAAGVPAIVSDGCAATDYVRHGENGLHFTHASAPALTAALQALAGDDVLAARLGAAAYRWYWDNPWTAARHVDDLLAIYRTIKPNAFEQQKGAA
jgi:glycosyltransferase involved in cell wall biosynthesis